MAEFHQGYFRPKNPEKYYNRKRLNEIVFRSSWERALMFWLDNNTDVVSWGSEEVVINYISKSDGRQHKYFVDFNVTFRDGTKLLVEVKPKTQTKPPVQTERKTKKRFLHEVNTYAVNTSKWDTAKIIAEKHGATFVIWTEDELAKLGIKLVTSKAFKYSTHGKKIKPLKPVRKKNANTK